MMSHRSVKKLAEESLDKLVSQSFFFFFFAFIVIHSNHIAFFCVLRYTQSLMEILEFLEKSPDDHSVLEG